MATWAPPIDADLAAGKPGKPSQARAIRDLPEALAERAAGAPWINRCGAFVILGPDDAPRLAQPGWWGYSSLEFDWAVPADVYRIDVTLIGGGGSGGFGSVFGVNGGGGGGGGAGAMVRQVIEVAPGEVHSVKIGSGGFPSQTHPSVNTDLDGYVTGDGARTVFGDLVAAGGKRGLNGALGSGDGIGGAGGGDIGFGVPTIPGGDGGAGLVGAFGIPSPAYPNGIDVKYGGRGGRSYFGDGAPRQYAAANGNSQWSNTTNDTVPGSGGGGGAYEYPTSQFGGRGCNGIVLLRY